MNLYQIILFTIFLIIISTSCENNKLEEVKELTEKINVNEEIAEDVNVTYTEEGKIKAILIAPELLKNNESKKPFTEFKKGINVKMFDKNEKQSGLLTADYAIKYDKEQETLVTGNVVVVNENGNKLETQELNRNDKTGALQTDKFVKITTEKEIIWGTGLEANEDFSWYKLDSMEGTIQVNKSEF